MTQCIAPKSLTTFNPTEDFRPMVDAQANRLLAVLSDCTATAQKVATELGLSPEEESEMLASLQTEIGRRAPQLIKVLCVLALLPIAEKRAFKHFRGKGETRHDAEELSHDVVLKILSAMTGSWPRGNVGAWLSVIREHVYADHHRKSGREHIGMERLEKAAEQMRRT
jgi:hypothetical protein